MPAPAEILVTVRLDADTYAAWRAEAQRRNAEVGQLLAAAAVHAIGPRSPRGGDRRPYRRLDQVQRAAVRAQRTAPASELARLFGVSENTIRNIWNEAS